MDTLAYPAWMRHRFGLEFRAEGTKAPSDFAYQKRGRGGAT